MTCSWHQLQGCLRKRRMEPPNNSNDLGDGVARELDALMLAQAGLWKRWLLLVPEPGSNQTSSEFRSSSYR